MRVGIRWLQDYVTFPYSAEELAERLTAIGTAVDGIDPVFTRFTGVVAARIKSVAPHPSRDKLRVLTVAHGRSESTVLAGAPNCNVGLIVPLARPGAILPPLGETPLGVRDMGGITSEGMVCSERDLGLSDDHSGLMELDEDEVKIGANLWDALHLDEMSLSFELTPNRGDCLSVLGIAREIGAIVGARALRPEIALKESAEAAAGHLSITLEDVDGCPRYAGRLVRGGRIGQSPFWLKRRLVGAGLRPINNAVDITNFVMMETGQPLHAFDWNTFKSGKVVVKAAVAGEVYTTLDDQERTLPADAVMITDGTRNVAIGGVMGGQGSEVADSTTDFLIESAHFNPSRIRRTRNKLGMATDAALRFEKTVDPNGVLYALDRAAMLFAELTGGEVLAGAVDAYPEPIEPIKLKLDPERANRLLGTNLSTPKMVDYLSQLDFGASPGKQITVTVPTFRPDVTRPVDLTEEIARLYGYERIPVSKRAAGILPTPRSVTDTFERRLRETVEGLGFSEMICNSLVDPGLALSPSGETVKLRNPLSSDLSAMRADLYSSGLVVVAHNLNRRVDVIALYEIGRQFAAQDGDWPYAEPKHLLLALCGHVPGSGWDQPVRPYDFYDLKGAVDTCLHSLGHRAEFERCEEAPFQAGEAFAVHADGQRIGAMGRIDTATARRFGVKDTVWMANLALATLVTEISEVPQYTPLPKFPAVYRDLAVIVDESVLAGDLEVAIRSAGGELVDTVTMFDRYTGDPIPKGKVNLAYAIAYRTPERTLTDADVDAVHDRIVAELANRFSAELRK